jgi:hypothetical protein
VSTELFGMVLASCRLRHHYGYRTPVTFSPGGAGADDGKCRRDAAAVWAACGADCDRRRCRLPDDQYGDRSGQLVDSGLAASDAADRVARELDSASLKRPGHGVPPPRSGLPLLGAP